MVCHSAHLRAGRDIAFDELDLVIAGLGNDLVAPLLPVFRIEVHQDEPGSTLGQLARGDATHAAGRAGNQYGLATHRPESAVSGLGFAPVHVAAMMTVAGGVSDCRSAAER